MKQILIAFICIAGVASGFDIIPAPSIRINEAITNNNLVAVADGVAVDSGVSKDVIMAVSTLAANAVQNATVSGENVVAGFRAFGAGKTNSVVLGLSAGEDASGNFNTYVGPAAGFNASSTNTMYIESHDSTIDAADSAFILDGTTGELTLGRPTGTLTLRGTTSVMGDMSLYGDLIINGFAITISNGYLVVESTP